MSSSGRYSSSGDDEDDDQELEFASADEGDSDSNEFDSDDHTDDNKVAVAIDENKTVTIDKKEEEVKTESKENKEPVVEETLEKNEQVEENKSKNLDDLSDLSDFDGNKPDELDSDLSDNDEGKVESKSRGEDDDDDKEVEVINRAFAESCNIAQAVEVVEKTTESCVEEKEESESDEEPITTSKVEPEILKPITPIQPVIELTKKEETIVKTEISKEEPLVEKDKTKIKNEEPKVVLESKVETVTQVTNVFKEEKPITPNKDKVESVKTEALKEEKSVSPLRQEPKVESEEQKKETLVPEVKETKSNVVSSGWDDTEFSDIEDEDDEQEEEDSKKIISPQKQKEEEPVVRNATSSQNITSSKSQNEIKPQSQAQPQQQQQQGWSWMKFGSSIVNTATNLTSQLVESVEASLGAPDPVELAKKSKLEREKIESEIAELKKKRREEGNQEEEDEFDDNWNDQGDWFSPINKITSTGKQLVTGSLDVLETVGKKTIEAINDKDPNLKQTREFLKMATTVAAPNKPNLSALLREAQEESIKNENSRSNAAAAKTSPTTHRPVREVEVLEFSACFDNYKGQVHLEALEMLSRQSTVKFEMQMLMLNEKRVTPVLEPLKKLFNLDEIINDDNDDVELNKEFDLNYFEDLFIDYMSELNVKLPIDRVIQSFKTASFTSKELSEVSEFRNESIKCFALITATMVEFFHKIAESLLIQQQNNTNKKPNYMTVHKGDNLCLITKLSIRSVIIIANDFCRNFKALHQEKSASINQTTANILLEASNGNTYIGDAYVLLHPIFKCLLLDEANLSS